MQLQNLRQNPLKPPQAETDSIENGLCRRFIWHRIIEARCFVFFKTTFACDREEVTPQAGKNLSRYNVGIYFSSVAVSTEPSILLDSGERLKQAPRITHALGLGKAC